MPIKFWYNNELTAFLANHLKEYFIRIIIIYEQAIRNHSNCPSNSDDRFTYILYMYGLGYQNVRCKYDSFCQYQYRLLFVSKCIICSLYNLKIINTQSQRTNLQSLLFFFTYIKELRTLLFNELCVEPNIIPGKVLRLLINSISF